MPNKVIALAGDYGYCRQIKTTIKSILYHNQNVTINVINTDIPQEWFYGINQNIKATDSKVIDCKITAEVLADVKPADPQTNYMTFGRLLIPRLITADRVLYLDSDLVVTGDLTPLFNLDFGNHPLAAVPDVIYDGDFNAGVLLLNNRLLRQRPELVDKMLKMGEDPTLEQADQTVLNHFFNQKYLHLPLKYNYVIGYDYLAFYFPEQVPNFLQKMATVKSPVITHFTSLVKPWQMASGMRMRELWWQYANLDWFDVISQQPLTVTRKPTYGTLWTFTQGESIQALLPLVSLLPDYEFAISSWTPMAESLNLLTRFANVHLYPSIVGPIIDELKEHAKVYLDVSLDHESNITQEVLDLGMPVIALEKTKDDRFSNNDNYHVFANEDYQGILDFIQEL